MALEIGVLLTMILFALLAIHSAVIRRAVIYLAVFSLLAGLLYLLYAAPELAIAEAVIGSGIVTLLYLAALRRNHVYTIGVVTGADGHVRDEAVARIEHSEAVRDIRDFFIKREFETQLVFLTVPIDDALRDPGYDLVIAENDGRVVVYSDEESYVIVELELMLAMHGTDSVCRFVRYSPEAVL